MYKTFRLSKNKGQPSHLQKDGKIAKPYQVKLVVKALQKLEVKDENLRID